MAQKQSIISTELEFNSPGKGLFELHQRSRPTTASIWFIEHFPGLVEKYGVPFVEVRETNVGGFSRVTPVSINLDFFAGLLGGDPKLGHSVVYFEPEMQFYFKEPALLLYKPTSPEKLQNLYRAILMRCAQELPDENNKLNLCTEFRNDKYARAVVQRAKSVLAADSSFFSATAQNQRIRGIELHERIARKFVEELLTCEPGHTLLLTEAYAVFCDLVKNQSLEPVKRSDFKAIVVPLIRDQFNVCLRNDLKIDERQGVRGWKNVKMVQTGMG